MKPMHTLLCSLTAAALLVAVPAISFAQMQDAGSMGRQQSGSMDNTPRLKSQIMARLADSTALQGSDISVEVSGNTATLSGTVADQNDIERAKRIAAESVASLTSMPI